MPYDDQPAPEHQRPEGVDDLTVEAVGLLTEALEKAERADRWTFQIVEEYDDTYWSVFRVLEKETRDCLTQGRRHLHEAELKEARRTHGHPDHTACPPARMLPQE